VLLQEAVNLHPRPEAQNLPNLLLGELARAIAFEREALKHSPRQVLHLSFQALGNIVGHFQSDLHWAFTSSMVSIIAQVMAGVPTNISGEPHCTVFYASGKR
jgi:hypothetical protein